MRLLIPLFSPVTGTWGGLTRVIAVAEAAQQAGHSVAFCASGELAGHLRQRGYWVYPTPPSTLFGLPEGLSLRMEARSQRVSLPVAPGKAVGNIWMVLALAGMARAGYLKKLVEAERQAALDFAANALFTDLDPGAFLLARIVDLPIASTYASIARQGIGSLPWWLVHQAIAAVMRAYGLRPERPEALCFGPQTLKIIPSIPELDDTPLDQPDACYVGQLLGEIDPACRSDFTSELGKRYIYVYVGTGSISLDRLRATLPQAFPAEGPHRVLVRAQSIRQVERLGAVEFRPYVPAQAVLPHVDLTLCHGGQNTIIQSLVYGAPLAIFPGPIFERRYNARKVQEAGAGRMGELPDFTPAWLQAVLADQARLAQAAAGLGRRIRAYGGAPQAVAALEAHVEKRQMQGEAARMVQFSQ